MTHNQLVNVPYMSITEHVYVNDALRLYKQLRPNEESRIDSVAVIVSREGILYHYQFRLLWRAVLIYKLNFPTNPIYANSELVIDSIIKKLKGVMKDYGLDRNERGEGEIE